MWDLLVGFLFALAGALTIPGHAGQPPSPVAVVEATKIPSSPVDPQDQQHN